MPVNSYPFYEATIDELPPLEEVRGILVTACNHPSEPCYMLIIGASEEIEQIIGFHIVGKKAWEESVRVEPDFGWVERVYTHCAQANRVNKECNDFPRIVFITEKGAWMIEVCYSNFLDENYIYGDDYYSDALYKDFEALDLINLN